MAHLNDDENRFARAVTEGITKAQAVDIQKGAADIRKDIRAFNTRLDANEQSILAAVRKIARRLDALEKTADENDPTSPKALEALIVKQKRAAGVPESCL